jgi:hypothetical protein
MRSRLIRLAVVVGGCASLVIVSPGAARGDTTCQVIDPQTGLCTIHVAEPPKPTQPTEVDHPADSSGPGASCYWDGTDQGITTPPPGPVPCRTPSGYWSNSLACYVMLLRPQPPAGDPSWRGHEPGDGAIYSCYQPQTDLMINIWSQNPPPGSGGGITPGEVAQLAIEQMQLRAIDVGIAPRAQQGSVGVVGMPVWMWVDRPSQSTFGPISRTASAGGLTVTATARIERITWSMGDGRSEVCTTPGTPYKPSYGAKRSPDCGHVYEQSSGHEPDNTYTVTATSSWVVTWAGAGQSGTIRLDDLSSSVAIAIGEGQVLVT